MNSYLSLRGRPPVLPVNALSSIPSPWELIATRDARYNADPYHNLRSPWPGVNSYQGLGCQSHNFHNHHHHVSPFHNRSDHDGRELSSRGYGYSSAFGSRDLRGHGYNSSAGSRDYFSAADFLKRWTPRSGDLSEIFIGNKGRYVIPFSERHLRLRVVRPRGYGEEEVIAIIPVNARINDFYENLAGGRDVEMIVVGRRDNRPLSDFRDMHELIDFDAEVLVLLEGRRGLW